MAIFSFNSTNISELLAEGTNLDMQDENGDTPLHYAVKTGSESLVDILLKHGINIDSRNKHNNTPLHEAIIQKNLPIVQKLLLGGCNVNLQNMFTFTPLHIAIRLNLDSIIESIIEAAADLNLKDFDGRTSLHLAIDINSRLGIITKLLEKKIDIFERNRSGKTPIFSAVRHESNELVTEMLLDKGFKADIRDFKGITPLHLVNGHTKKRTVELLLDSGVEMDVKGPKGWTPLFHAVQCNNIPVVDLLLNRGADVNIQDIAGKSPLHVASMGHNLGLVKRLLLDKTINIDQKDKHGLTALLQAVRDNNVPMVDLLLLNGSSINVRDRNGNSPFHIASRCCCQESLERLLCEKDCDVNKRDIKGNTPLLLAAEKNHERIINLLLKNGASLNLQNRIGWTPLHAAIHYERSDSVVPKLLGAGAKLDILDNMGNSPLDKSAKLPDSIRRKYRLNNFLKEHVVKMRCANLKIGLKIQNYDFTTYKHFTKSCLMEVKKIRRKMFGGVSLIRLFSYTDCRNPVLAGNSEMEDFMNSRRLESEFPIYSTLLKLKFNEIKERNSLLCSIVFDIRVKEGKSLRDVHLPNELKRTILCYLTNKELENLKKACQ